MPANKLTRVSRRQASEARWSHDLSILRAGRVWPRGPPNDDNRPRACSGSIQEPPGARKASGPIPAGRACMSRPVACNRAKRTCTTIVVWPALQVLCTCAAKLRANANTHVSIRARPSAPHSGLSQTETRTRTDQAVGDSVTRGYRRIGTWCGGSTERAAIQSPQRRALRAA